MTPEKQLHPNARYRSSISNFETIENILVIARAWKNNYTPTHAIAPLFLTLRLAKTSWSSHEPGKTITPHRTLSLPYSTLRPRTMPIVARTSLQIFHNGSFLCPDLPA